ncbi:hypothetical protein LINGRAHAP2_LOCUS31311 [Linum grandiflorum]
MYSHLGEASGASEDRGRTPSRSRRIEEEEKSVMVVSKEEEENSREKKENTAATAVSSRRKREGIRLDFKKKEEEASASEKEGREEVFGGAWADFKARNGKEKLPMASRVESGRRWHQNPTFQQFWSSPKSGFARRISCRRRVELAGAGG